MPFNITIALFFFPNYSLLFCMLDCSKNLEHKFHGLYNFCLLCLPSFNNQFYFQCRTLLLFILLPLRTFLVAIFLISMESSCFSHISSYLKISSFEFYYSQRNCTCFAPSNDNPVLSNQSPILYLVCIFHLELDCIAFNNSAYLYI